jgi:hypothetical protein
MATDPDGLDQTHPKILFFDQTFWGSILRRAGSTVFFFGEKAIFFKKSSFDHFFFFLINDDQFLVLGPVKRVQDLEKVAHGVAPSTAPLCMGSGRSGDGMDILKFKLV